MQARIDVTIPIKVFDSLIYICICMIICMYQFFVGIYLILCRVYVYISMYVYTEAGVD